MLDDVENDLWYGGGQKTSKRCWTLWRMTLGAGGGGGKRNSNICRTIWRMTLGTGGEKI